MKPNSFYEIIGGEQYQLFAKAVPHFKEFQGCVARQVGLVTSNEPNTTVLEIGCGPGTTTYEIARRQSNNALTIIDIEPEMIKQAKKNLADFKNIEYVCQDCAEYLRNLPDESINTIYSAWTIHNFTQKEKEEVFKDIFRVLKNGGHFINGDKFAQNNKNEHAKSLLKQLNQIREAGLEINNSEWSTKWIDHYLFDDTPEIIMFENDAKQAMKNLGFTNVKTLYRKQMEAVVIAKKVEK